jgi:hypothetical protein
LGREDLSSFWKKVNQKEDDANYTWFQRRFQGRQTRRGGKGKGKRKGRGKGRGGRRFFRPRRKDKGKGREEKDVPTWWVKKNMKKNGKRQKNGMRHGKVAIGPKKRTGMKAHGSTMICTTRMSMDFQRKGKGKGKGKKGKKGKDDEGKGGKPGDGKGKSNYVQPQTPSLPAPQQQAHYSSAASSSGHGFLATVETEC